MTEQKITFVPGEKDRNLFFSELRHRVDQYFKENRISKHGNSRLIIKTVILLSGYLVPFAILLIFQLPVWTYLLLWGLMGLAKAGIGMSVMHDANHGAYSASHKTNYWMGHTLNLLGGSVFNWKLQHNLLHHTYTNIHEMDEDIDTKGGMRFSPHTHVRWFHRFQFVYAFILYGMLTLYWVLFKDFVQYFSYTRSGVSKLTKKQHRAAFLRIILFKIIYYSVFLVIPITVLGQPWAFYLLGFLLMQFLAGLILSVIFQLAHTVEHTAHPIPDESGNIENSWAIHQMNTTANFSRENKLISWYVGGLNFQVEHHLFPAICHIHYPAIAHIVKATAEEFGIPYLESKTFGAALRSHVHTLQRFGSVQTA